MYKYQGNLKLDNFSYSLLMLRSPSYYYYYYKVKLEANVEFVGEK